MRKLTGYCDYSIDKQQMIDKPKKQPYWKGKPHTLLYEWWSKLRDHVCKEEGSSISIDAEVKLDCHPISFNPLSREPRKPVHQCCSIPQLLRNVIVFQLATLIVSVSPTTTPSKPFGILLCIKLLSSTLRNWTVFPDLQKSVYLGVSDTILKCSE